MKALLAVVIFGVSGLAGLTAAELVHASRLEMENVRLQAADAALKAADDNLKAKTRELLVANQKLQDADAYLKLACGLK